MTTLPLLFEERMKTVLGNEAEAFFEAIRSNPPVSVRMNPAKPVVPFPDILKNSSDGQVPWCPDAWYLDSRPVFTLDPVFHGGAYYVQEASSMFLHHIIRQIAPQQPLRVLDLCAAPGGKSTLLASALPENSLLVSNEVIRSRASILRENIIKWGSGNIVVTNNDPADFRGLTGTFDIILVDAPCSGEGMFRKDPKAIDEWSEANLSLCAERQKRILSDIWDALKPEGYLIYSTCTYNRNENEGILKWLINHHEAQGVEISHPFEGIVSADAATHGYHFYPHRTTGEGFFIGVVQKTDGEESSPRKNRKQDKTRPVSLSAEISRRIRNAEDFSAYTTTGNLTGFLPTLHREFAALLERELRVIYQGCEAAEIIGQKMRLLPALALYSGLIPEACSVFDADRASALSYLKKEDITVPAKAGEWVLISHLGIGLGWGKSVGNRLNNYYPKEWRIRMDIRES